MSHFEDVVGIFSRVGRNMFLDSIPHAGLLTWFSKFLIENQHVQPYGLSLVLGWLARSTPNCPRGVSCLLFLW